VVISIQEGKVLPSMLLRKLSNYSRKNRLYQAFRELGCVVRTVFLLQFLSDEKLREVIQSTTNKMEQFNAFCKWLLFGGEGKISDNTPEDQEKRIKYNDLIANCVILNNTVELSDKLNTLAQEGYVFTKDELAALSPYQTQHVKRFGHYELDLQTVPQPITDDLLFDIIIPDNPLPLLGTETSAAG
jgi:TnpA family transposase